MVECYLEAKLTACISEDNPFYGKLTRKAAIRDEYEMDKDVREDIAPSGVKLQTIIGNSNLELSISRHYLNIDGDGWYYATFSDENLVYGLDLHFDGDEIDVDSTYIFTQYSEDYMAGDSTIKDKVYGRKMVLIYKLER